MSNVVYKWTLRDNSKFSVFIIQFIFIYPDICGHLIGGGVCISENILWISENIPYMNSDDIHKHYNDVQKQLTQFDWQDKSVFNSLKAWCIGLAGLTTLYCSSSIRKHDYLA